jgi:hypothetical protein
MMPYLQHDNWSWRGSASVVKPKRTASVKLAPTSKYISDIVYYHGDDTDEYYPAHVGADGHAQR